MIQSLLVMMCVVLYLDCMCFCGRYTTDWSLGKPSLLTTDGFYTPGLPSRQMVEKDICRYIYVVILVCKYSISVLSYSMLPM